MLEFILLTSICQIVLYLVFDKFNLKFGRLTTFLALLIGNIFVFPKLFYPEVDPNSFNCGMSLMGINFVFWIIGGGAAILIHAAYWLHCRNKE